MAYDRTLLTSEALQGFLTQHPDWHQKTRALLRTYTFSSFPQAIAFVNKVAEVAEAKNHHPDIDIRFQKVTLLLTTHDAGGLTFRDPEVATEVDRLYANMVMSS